MTGNTFAKLTPETTHERIQGIGSRLGGIKRYLEIGVAKGTTFFKVNAQEKHAVDPRFRFDIATRRDFTNESYHPMTSDEFFMQCIGKKVTFDFIFLDGLHTYSQTLRDFLACQALAHHRTIWLIDDTVPTDPVAAEPDLKRVKNARAAQGKEEDQTWMGDVFKLVAFIDGFCPQFTCLTLENHGQTLILPVPRRSLNGKYNSTNEIEKLNYVDALLLQKNLLKPTSWDQIMDQVDKLKSIHQ